MACFVNGVARADMKVVRHLRADGYNVLNVYENLKQQIHHEVRNSYGYHDDIMI